MPHSATEDLIHRTSERLVAARDATSALVTTLTPLQRTQAPHSGAWSVDQILEHLTIVNALYGASMHRAIAHASAERGLQRAATSIVWKPTLIGRLLHKAVHPSTARRLPAPKRVQPGPLVAADVLPRFVRSVDTLIGLIADSAPFDINRVRFASPILSVIRLNLGDGFLICAAHIERHLAQLQRAVAVTARPV